MTEKLCPNCGATLRHLKGVSKKNGRPYEGYVCPDKCGFEGEWLKVKAQAESGNAILMEEVKSINDRLDRLIAYVVKNLPEK